MPVVCIILCLLLLGLPVAKAETDYLLRDHRGVRIVSHHPATAEIDGVTTTPAQVALDRIILALDQVLSASPMVADRIAALQRKGRIQISYDARHPKGVMTSVTLASYLPDYYDPLTGKRDFVVLFGRTGIQWGPDHIASTIAHELAGHAYQDMEQRLEGMQLLDIECEAYLVEEQAKQDLGYDKTTNESIELRKRMENHWCDDFRRHTVATNPAVATEWDRLNPDVPRLLTAFRAYMAGR